jgi:hypothetical protein
LPFKKKCIFEHNLESILPLDLVCKFTWWISRLRGELGPWCHSLSDGAVVDIICFSWGVLYKVQMPPGPLSLHPCCWFHIWLCTLWMQNSVWPCPLHTRAHTHTHTHLHWEWHSMDDSLCPKHATILFPFPRQLHPLGSLCPTVPHF